MEHRLIEAWVHRVIAEVERGGSVEDARVELKRDWPDSASKAARRIAGHANAAPSEHLLWIIGVDEKLGAQCVVGATSNDLARWWPAVQAEFNQVPPELVASLNVPINDALSVVALVVRGDRIPYVVKVPESGTVKGLAASLEVPYREGTRVRSATHAQLVRMLSAFHAMPIVDAVDGSIHLDREGTHLRLRVTLRFDVLPSSPDIVSLQARKCEAYLDGGTGSEAASQIPLRPRLAIGDRGPGLDDGWLTIDGPTTMSLFSETWIQNEGGSHRSMRLVVRLFSARGTHPVSISADFVDAPITQPGGSAVRLRSWTFGNPRPRMPSIVAMSIPGL